MKGTFHIQAGCDSSIYSWALQSRALVVCQWGWFYKPQFLQSSFESVGGGIDRSRWLQQLAIYKKTRRRLFQPWQYFLSYKCQTLHSVFCSTPFLNLLGHLNISCEMSLPAFDAFETSNFQPDWYCRKIIIKSKDPFLWKSIATKRVGFWNLGLVSFAVFMWSQSKQYSWKTIK